MLKRKWKSNKSHFNLLKNNAIKGFRPTLLAVAIAQTLTLATGTQAATIVVNTALDTFVDDSTCSLREAVASMTFGSIDETGCVNSGAAFGSDDQINFSVASVNLTEGQLNISTSLSINGGNDGVSIIGNNTSRLLNLSAQISSASTITLNNLTLAGGSEYFGGGIYVKGDVTLNTNHSTVTENQAHTGGGIYAKSGGGEPTLNLSNTVISNNTTTYGGGIFFFSLGTMTLNETTVSNNTASEGAGGILTFGTTNLNNSTVSGNHAASYGGGIFAAAIINLNNSTVSNNEASIGGGIASNVPITTTIATLNNSIIANSTGGDCHIPSGTITANNKNIIEDGSCGTDALSVDPLLGPLADNGGPTETHALLDGSPAINAGDNAICAAPPINNLDQRGVIRPIDAICDIGAIEFEAPPETSDTYSFVIPLPNGKVVSFNL